MSKTLKNTVVVKEYETIRADIGRIDYIFNNCAGDYYIKYFHTFEIRSILDIEKMNGVFVSGIISDEKLEQYVQKNGFIQKLTIKIYSHH